MGKSAENKRIKKEALLQTASELFSEKGFSKTTISDIVEKAGLAKGTFYLYFKDKYDLQNKLVAYRAGRLFADALQELQNIQASSFEDELIFVTDYIIKRFQEQNILIQFVAKNLSWGIFLNTLSSPDFLASQDFYEYYLQAFDRYGLHCEQPDLLLFTLIELIGSTSYSCLLYHQPVSMEEYLPWLHKSLRQIISVFVR